MNNKQLSDKMNKISKNIISTKEESAQILYYRREQKIEIILTVTPGYSDTMKTITSAMKDLESDVKRAIVDGKNYGIKKISLKLKEWVWMVGGFQKSWMVDLDKNISDEQIDELVSMFKKYGIVVSNSTF